MDSGQPVYPLALVRFPVHLQNVVLVLSVLTSFLFSLVIQCGDPGTPLNGNRDLSGRSVSSVVRYTCNVGYSISGDQSRTCQSSGFWSGSLPSCSCKHQYSHHLVMN